VTNDLLIVFSVVVHFSGSKECGILQSDLYPVPGFRDDNPLPFCRNKTMLLEALTEGGRIGLDQPFFGQGES
jgi:hypothetical protein